MRLDRGMVFFGIMVSLIIVLTLALATVVYKGTPSQDLVLGSNNPVLDTYLELPVHGYADSGTLSDNGSGDGLLLGSGPGDEVLLGSGSEANSIIGSWQEPGSGDIYTFDGSRCAFNFDIDNAVPYYAHWETVYTPSNTPVRSLVYSCNGDPDEGFAFLDGSLRFVVRGNTRWEFWYALTKADPILGRWRHASDRTGYRFEFDPATFSDYYVSWKSHDGRGWPYKKIDAWVRVYDSSWKTYNDHYLSIYRVPVDDGHPEVTLRGYAFINGVLYDIRSSSPGETGLETGPGFECIRV